mmetsp:Transcript_3968/g.7962  ORF Transcript_3968/g.7962 Transcript_3968/m.7962 type:complete len:354 (-) Transcript_3968:224-1285(-)
MPTEVRNIRNANFPKNGEGRTYHVFTKDGEVANRVVTVGAHHRAKMISSFLDDVKHVGSDRGFETYTGTLRGTPVSVIATGMGLPMVDMMVREVNACCEGKMLFLRLGTCGTPSSKVPIGTVTVNNRCVLITRMYNAFHKEGSNGESKQIGNYYSVSDPIPADKDLTDNLVKELKKRITKYPVTPGLGATCDSFYGSQGRIDPWFQDHNDRLIDELMEKEPEAVTLEMETGHLLHLAKTAKNSKIRAGGCAIVLAQRKSNAFLSKDETYFMEREAAIAVLEALITTPLSADDETVAEPLDVTTQMKLYDVMKRKQKNKAQALSMFAYAAAGFTAVTTAIVGYRVWNSKRATWF